MLVVDGYQVVQPEIAMRHTRIQLGGQKPGHSECCTVSMRHSFVVVVHSGPHTAFHSPEKDHETQLRSFAMDHPEYQSTVRLVVLGGAQNKDFLERVGSLYQHRFATSGDHGARRRYHPGRSIKFSDPSSLAEIMECTL